MIDGILRANNMTVEEAIDELGTVCSDFLLVCTFAGKKFPCLQVGSGNFIVAIIFSFNDISFTESQVHQLRRIVFVSGCLLLFQLSSQGDC